MSADNEQHPANALVNILLGAFITGTLALGGFLYNFQNSKLWEQGQAIAEIKTAQANGIVEETRLEKGMADINTTLQAVNTTLQSLKDGNNENGAAVSELHKQLDTLSKQVSDIDLVLRPLRGVPNHP